MQRRSWLRYAVGLGFAPLDGCGGTAASNAGSDTRVADIPLEWDDPYLFVRAQANGGALRMLLDTGADATPRTPVRCAAAGPRRRITPGRARVA